MLGPARTPRDATELTETAAARLRTSRSGIPPFGLLPQCTCGALRASATGTTAMNSPASGAHAARRLRVRRTRLGALRSPASQILAPNP